MNILRSWVMNRHSREDSNLFCYNKLDNSDNLNNKHKSKNPQNKKDVGTKKYQRIINFLRKRIINKK